VVVGPKVGKSIMPRVSKLEPSNLTGEADPDITMESEKESKAKPITMKLP